MRKVLTALVAILLASLSLTATAEAQDVQRGTVVADPQTVPAAGEYTFTATGSDFIPDTSILLLKCTLPGATVTSVEEALAASANLEPLSDCDIAAAQNVDVDSSGNWTAELTAEVGDNFLVSAGDLAGTQAGGTWIPIVGAATTSEDDAAADEEEAAEEEPAAEEEAAEEELAETGVETGMLAVIGAAVLGAGVIVTRESRRFRK